VHELLLRGRKLMDDAGLCWQSLWRFRESSWRLEALWMKIWRRYLRLIHGRRNKAGDILSDESLNM